MMKKVFFLCSVLLSLMLFSSCSTIINSTSQDVIIRTEPANAKLVIDGKKFGTTPQVVNLDRKNNHVVKIELDGYDVYETQITTKLSPWFWGNIVTAIIPGVTIDLLTGAMYDLLPDSFNIQLQQAKKVETAPKR